MTFYFFTENMLFSYKKGTNNYVNLSSRKTGFPPLSMRKTISMMCSTEGSDLISLLSFTLYDLKKAGDFFVLK